MRFGLMVVAALIGAPVAAQDLPSLSEVTGRIDGLEVQTNGVLRYSPSPSGMWNFSTEDGLYRANLAVGREVMKVAEGCVVELFTENTGCSATASAEIAVKGGDITLLIFDLKFLK
jgi:hypothetical protein